MLYSVRHLSCCYANVPLMDSSINKTFPYKIMYFNNPWPFRAIVYNYGICVEHLRVDVNVLELILKYLWHGT
jgi:hypothetical protein